MPSLRPLAGAVLAAAALLFLVRLGATDLWAPDEPRYAQIAEEVRGFGQGARGLWLLHLNGEAYDQKPPVYFWLAALFGAPGGRVDELAARLPSALAGVACVALVLRLGSALSGPAVGIAAGALLATSPLFVHMARRAQLDVLLCAFELLALTAFWRIDQIEPRRARDVALLHAALGLAVLTKGPVGFITPVLAIVAFLAWEGRLRDLRRCFPVWGLLLSLGPGLVWIAGASALAPTGFAESALVANLWDRFVHGTAHVAPPWYYVTQLPLDWLPWSLLAPVVWISGRRVLQQAEPAARRSAWRFLLAWLGSAFVFFSLSSGKRGLYLLPVYPAAALLSADAVIGALAAGSKPPRWIGTALAALAALATLAGLALPLLARRYELNVPAAFPVLWVGLAIASAIGFRAAGTSWLRRSALVIASVALAELLVFGMIFPAMNAEKSPRGVAQAAASLTRPDERVGVTRRTLAGALNYYGGRRVEKLDQPGSIERFLAAGGRVIVTEASQLERSEALARADVRFRAWHGRRALVVVEVAPAPGGAP